MLTQEQVQLLLQLIPTISTVPARDMLIFTLSLFAAMRPCEIAHLFIDQMLGPSGEILDYIRILPGSSKGDEGRTLDMHPLIRAALEEFMDVYPGVEWVAFSPQKGRKQLNPGTLGLAMKRVYEKAGLLGCTGHSGRATATTELASFANLHGGSLRDVQEFVGHKHLETTAGYLRKSGAIRDMVWALGTGHNKKARLNHGTRKQATRYRARQSPSVRRDDDATWGGLLPAGQPHADRDGRRNAERAANWAELNRPKRKPRQHRPPARDC
jgi:integrase